MKFAPYFPVKPFALNQGWGTDNQAVYAQFGFNRHNGIDARMGADKLVRAPFAGTVVKNGNQPNGGGIFCGFISDDEYDFDAFECITPDGSVITFPAMRCRVLFDFLHLEAIKAVEGQHYQPGDVLAVQDNTGFSTGPHTHIQCRRVSWDGISIKTLDSNGANNSFDPTQFWNGQYPADLASLKQQLSLALSGLALSLRQWLERSHTKVGISSNPK